jgi:hypothetical protein
MQAGYFCQTIQDCSKERIHGRATLTMIDDAAKMKKLVIKGRDLVKHIDVLKRFL